MGWELVQNRNAEFAIHWETIERLLRSYWTARLQYKYAEEVTISDSEWYNPLSWSLPDVKQIEVDWDLVRRDTDRVTAEELRSIKNRVKYDARSVANALLGRMDEAAWYKEQFVNWMGDIQDANKESINKSVEAYESHIEVAKFVRDTSADGLMVCASVLTGGAAIAATGGASIFKGYAKFQDTGRVGPAVLEGAGSFVFAYVKLGKRFSFKEDMVLALIQAPYKTGTELASGESLSAAVAAGSVQLVGPGIERMLNRPISRKLFEVAAIPMTVNLETGALDKAAFRKGMKVMQGWTAESIKKDLEDRGKAFVSVRERDESLSDEDDSNLGRGALLREATMTNKALLYLGFVNQANGVGRGW